MIVPSKVLGRYLMDRFHVPPERLRVIPRGVDLSAFPLRRPRAPEEKGWQLGLIGRPSPLKGHEVAIRALHQLVGHGLPVRLVLVGAATEPPTRLRARLDQLAKELEGSCFIDWRIFESFWCASDCCLYALEASFCSRLSLASCISFDGS